MKFRTALLAMLVTAMFAASAHAQMLRVTIRKAPIRTGPGSTQPLVTNAMEGDILEYVDVEGLYYIVRVPGTQQVGYVHSALVAQTAQPTPYPNDGPTPTSSPPPPPPSAAPSAQSSTAPPPPPPRRTSRTPPPPPASTTREGEPLPNTQPSVDPTLWDDAPWEHRRLGIGGRFGHSTLGNMAFNFRTWRNTAGLSLDVAADDFMWQLQPSMMFKIGGPITSSAVYFQPYFGVGADMYWSRLTDNDGVGVVALGGTDIGFTALQNLTVSFDLGYHSDWLDTDCRSDCFTSNFSDRLGLNFGFNWYFK